MTNARIRPFGFLIATAITATVLVSSATPAFAQDEDTYLPPKLSQPREEESKPPIMPLMTGILIMVAIVSVNVISSKRGHQD